jgi:hypothetical protein
MDHAALGHLLVSPRPRMLPVCDCKLH